MLAFKARLGPCSDYANAYAVIPLAFMVSQCLTGQEAQVCIPLSPEHILIYRKETSFTNRLKS